MCYRYHIPFVPLICTWLIRLIFNSFIPSETRIGKGVDFGHGIGIVINRNAIIGDNVEIGHQVTIGGSPGQDTPPIIGNNVFIGAGAKIIGAVRIGDYAKIGANAVVVKDVKSGETVFGVPAESKG